MHFKMRQRFSGCERAKNIPVDLILHVPFVFVTAGLYGITRLRVLLEHLMLFRTIQLMLLSLVLSPVLAANAQAPVMDGVLDAAFYGAPLSVQDTPTTFGNATNGHARFATGGSELDAAYARISDGTLFLFIAGNLETGGQGVQFPSGSQNRFDIFIDSIPGGQNSLRGDNVDVDSGGLNRMGHLDAANDGLKFDAGVSHDFYFTFYNFTEVQDFGSGYGNQEIWRGRLYYATIPTLGGGTALTIGTAADTYPGSYPSSFTLGYGVRLGFRNSNTRGVTGSGDLVPSAADATNVTTGLELAIPVTLIDGPEGELNPEIKITAFVSSSDHSLLSNQVLGPMGQTSPYGNLNDPRLFDFSQSYSPGSQYFTASNPYSSSRVMFSLVVQEDSTVSNRWISEPGLPYVLQRTTNLVTGPWTNVSVVVTATAPVLSIVDTNTDLTLRYYRAAQLQY